MAIVRPVGRPARRQVTPVVPGRRPGLPIGALGWPPGSPSLTQAKQFIAGNVPRATGPSPSAPDGASRCDQS